MISLESDEMNALWPKNSLTFTFMGHSKIAYQTDQRRNDCSVTKWLFNYHFLAAKQQLYIL